MLTVNSGVSLPLLSKRVRWFATDSAAFVVGRAFAAGVVLATGFVHLFPDAMENLTNPCLGWGGAGPSLAPALMLLLRLARRQVQAIRRVRIGSTTD